MHGAVLHGAWLVRTTVMWTRDVLVDVDVLQNDGRANTHGGDLDPRKAICVASANATPPVKPLRICTATILWALVHRQSSSPW